MEDSKVSVIIPAYNAQDYIARAVGSVVAQTYKNWEIIIIENGSSDKTTDICKKVAEQSSRIRLYHSEKGVSNARNLGLNQAEGKWIVFLDADDWLERDALKFLVKAAEQDDADLVSAEYTYLRRQSGQTSVVKGKDNVEQYLIQCLCNPTQKCNVTACLFRLEFIRRHKIQFDVSLSHAEDSVFLVSLLLENPVITGLDLSVYHVYYNPVSSVRSGGMSLRTLYKNAIDCIDKLLEEKGPEVRNAFQIFILNQLLIVLVHDTEAGTGGGQIKKIKHICGDMIFVNALTSADLKQMPVTKRIILSMIKKKILPGVFVGVKIRQMQNQIKSKRDENIPVCSLEQLKMCINRQKE